MKNVIFKYSNLESAKEAAYRLVNFSKHSIVKGDDGYFWITTNRTASRLEKEGFEIVF